MGVHGASLTWSAFQKPNTTNIEIAWPKYGWPFVNSTSNMHALVCGVFHPCTLLCFVAYGFFTEGTTKLPVESMVLPLCNEHALVFAPFHTCTSGTALQPVQMQVVPRKLGRETGGTSF